MADDHISGIVVDSTELCGEGHDPVTEQGHANCCGLCRMVVVRLAAKL